MSLPRPGNIRTTHLVYGLPIPNAATQALTTTHPQQRPINIGTIHLVYGLPRPTTATLALATTHP